MVLASTTPMASVPAVRISNDDGGNIGVYWERFMAVRKAGEQVVIDGTCSSACTMVLGIVSHDRICVTANARLGFHAAYRGFLWYRVTNDPATRTLMAIYPEPIRHWIDRHGGLSGNMIYLSGSQLFALYRKCR
jgi:hypothetical protein